MPNRITVRVPATSANLGCAFDCAALALSVYLDIHVTPRRGPRNHGAIPRRGRRSACPPTIRTSSRAPSARRWQAGTSTRASTSKSRIRSPSAWGSVSSAAAIVGALAACHWLADTTLFDEQLISLATKIEGPPRQRRGRRGTAASPFHFRSADASSPSRAPWPDNIKLVLVVPDYAMPTEKAREVLPREYRRADSVHNLQRAVALAAQMFFGQSRHPSRILRRPLAPAAPRTAHSRPPRSARPPPCRFARRLLEWRRTFRSRFRTRRGGRDRRSHPLDPRPA